MTQPPCYGHGEMFFATEAYLVEQARNLCLSCSDREECLEGALGRRESWGVWGGQLFADGRPVAPERLRTLKHGSRVAAQRYGCSCGPCEAWRERDRQAKVRSADMMNARAAAKASYREAAAELGRVAEDGHGTQEGYKAHGCRCSDCKQAHREGMVVA